MSTHSGDPAVHGHGDTHGHGSQRDYAIGALLSIILTVVPFWLVMARPLASTSLIAALIFGLALVQIVVHVVAFLHLDTRSEGGWSMLALIFTVVLVVIVLSGSIWVMYHLDHNMMPHMSPGMSVQQMRDMP